MNLTSHDFIGWGGKEERHSRKKVPEEEAEAWRSGADSECVGWDAGGALWISKDDFNNPNVCTPIV
jgi:hypothetical protein